MFSLFGKKDKKIEQKQQGGIPSSLLAMRETLYSNSSLEPMISRLADGSKKMFPWSNFIEANQALKRNDKAKAISLLKQIVETENLNTRIYLQAWHTLTSLGEMPAESQRGQIQGAVVEYYRQEGLDIIAAYRDYTARYWNFSGKGIIWETRDPQIDKAVDNLLTVGQEIMRRLTLHRYENLPVPPMGNIRIFLTGYDASCYGMGLFDEFSKDEMGRYAINAAINLMNSLIEKQQSSKQKA